MMPLLMGHCRGHLRRDRMRRTSSRRLHQWPVVAVGPHPSIEPDSALVEHVGQATTLDADPVVVVEIILQGCERPTCMRKPHCSRGSTRDLSYTSSVVDRSATWTFTIARVVHRQGPLLCLVNDGDPRADCTFREAEVRRDPRNGPAISGDQGSMDPLFEGSQGRWIIVGGPLHVPLSHQPVTLVGRKIADINSHRSRPPRCVHTKAKKRQATLSTSGVKLSPECEDKTRKENPEILDLYYDRTRIGYSIRGGRSKNRPAALASPTSCAGCLPTTLANERRTNTQPADTVRLIGQSQRPVGVHAGWARRWTHRGSAPLSFSARVGAGASWVWRRRRTGFVDGPDRWPVIRRLGHRLMFLVTVVSNGSKLFDRRIGDDVLSTYHRLHQ